MTGNDQAQQWLPGTAGHTEVRGKAGHTHGTVGDNSVSKVLQGHDSILYGFRNPSN